METARPRMPPTARAALIAPRPSGPVWSTSRERLGRSAWCAKPSTSAPAVSSISTSSMRSSRTAVTKPVTPRQIESGAPVATGARARAGSRARPPSR